MKKTHKNPKQPRSQISDLSLLITQAKVNVTQRQSQTSAKATGVRSASDPLAPVLPKPLPLPSSSKKPQTPNKSEIAKTKNANFNIWLNSSDSLVIQRHSKDRTLEPDKVFLERLGLLVCPILQGESNVSLLSYKKNSIKKISNLSLFTSLVYLDFTGNLLSSMSGLEGLANLRILLLGSNCITEIEGLENQQHLDVLDLSDNKIKQVKNLSHLNELRVLKLFKNGIEVAENFRGLDSLVELHLEFNEITQANDISDLHSLQKLFLDHNCIERSEDMQCVFNAESIQELSINDCPMSSQDVNFRQLLFCSLPHIKLLDGKRILEEEKRSAITMFRKEESRKQETILLSKLKDAKEKAIGKARQEWERLMKSGLVDQTDVTITPKHLSRRVNGKKEWEDEGEDTDDDQIWCGSLTSGRNGSAPLYNTKPGRVSHKTVKKGSWKFKNKTKRFSDAKSRCLSERVMSEADLSHLVEVDDGKLELYGNGAVLVALKHYWQEQTVTSINHASFYYVVFDNISAHLRKIKLCFPRIVSVSFMCASIHNLCQINAIAQFYDLESLHISEEGNSVTELETWRLYSIYRLSSSLKSINNLMVTHEERIYSEDLFAGLGRAVSIQLPKYRLFDFMNDPRVKQMFFKERGFAPNSMQKTSESQIASDAVTKAFLTYKLHQKNISTFQAFAQAMFKECINNCEEITKKQCRKKEILPTVVLDVITSSLDDFLDLNHYMKQSMQNLCQEPS